MRGIVVLRPEPGASETLAGARALGLDGVAIPLFTVGPVDWEVPDPKAFDGLLLTSANAVRHAGAGLVRLSDVPVYAVGEATAAAARKVGLEVAAVGDAGVEALLASIAPDLRLLHLAGEVRKDAGRAPQEIAPVVVYRSKLVEAPSLSALDGNVALVHSPRAGQRLAELVGNRTSVAIAAISPAAASACGSGWGAIEAAERPSDAALLALAARLCNKPEP